MILMSFEGISKGILHPLFITDGCRVHYVKDCLFLVHNTFLSYLRSNNDLESEGCFQLRFEFCTFLRLLLCFIRKDERYRNCYQDVSVPQIKLPSTIKRTKVTIPNEIKLTIVIYVL